MDSLTQITLGAAVGEIALGKKVGNRAMLWGAIAGTIPDLDVLGNLVLHEIDALAFHRGITHSFFFALIAPPIFGWLVHQLYSSDLYKTKGYKWTITIFNLLLLFMVFVGIGFFPTQLGGSFNYSMLGVGAVAAFLGGLAFHRWYVKKEMSPVEATWKGWTWLFFLGIFTHPLLDSCTPYGTQLFQPFWDYRVAFNNISVVDPIYTLPFLFCLIIAGFYTRRSKMRTYFNLAGLFLSTLYLAFTVSNKFKVDSVFETSLQRHAVPYIRYSSSPTIFNNVLWQGMGETENDFHFAMYSLLDEEPIIKEFKVIPKNHHLIDKYAGNEHVEILKWFANGYYSVIERKDGRLQFNVLLFGILDADPKEEDSYVFKFIIEEKDGKVEVYQSEEMPDQGAEFLEVFWTRLKGI